MTHFDRAFAELLEIEGRFGDHAADPGGKTRYGITEAVARANGYQGDMRVLPIEEAQRIYRARYWDVNGLDLVAEIAPAIALELFDTGVNQGVATAAQFLQRSLNALNQGGAPFGNLKVDGVLGQTTVAAFASFVAMRRTAGVTVLLRALNCLQGARYIEIAERREASEAFVFGWLLNRVVIP